MKLFGGKPAKTIKPAKASTPAKPGSVRKHMYFSGRVQGVGFRYTAYYSAGSLGLTGWVKNLDDGRVEMEIQGDQAVIDQMLLMIQQGSFIRIDEIEEEELPVIRESSFSMLN